MKSCVFTATVLILLIVFLPVFINARHIRNLHSQQTNHPMNPVISRKKAMARTEMSWELRKGSTMHKRGAETLQIAGSRLPDCSHACGSCRPCRLVMVSFVCSSLEEAETCPMAYKCMCHNKSYPVP